MHRKFAEWLSDHLWGAAFFAAIFGVLSPQGLSPFAVFAGAIPVLLTLRVSASAGMNAALAGSIAVVTLLCASGESLLVALGFAIGLFWMPQGLALGLRRTGSLNLGFQLTILGAGILLCVVYAAFDDAVAQWKALLDEASKAVTDAGLVEDRKAVVASLAASNWGTYVTLWALTILGALFVGRWWHSQLDAPGAFGIEYQQLRLGKLLGSVTLAIVIGGFVIHKFDLAIPLVDALMWIAVAGLTFQGLAAAHKLKAAGHISRGWLTAIYVLLIVPISTMLMIVLLAGWGLADNWQRSRVNGT